MNHNVNYFCSIFYTCLQNMLNGCFVFKFPATSRQWQESRRYTTCWRSTWLESSTCTIKQLDSLTKGFIQTISQPRSSCLNHWLTTRTWESFMVRPYVKFLAKIIIRVLDNWIALFNRKIFSLITSFLPIVSLKNGLSPFWHSFISLIKYGTHHPSSFATLSRSGWRL